MTAPADAKAYALRFLEPWNAHDIDAVLRDLPEDFEWQFTTGSEPTGTVCRGHAELRGALERLFATILDLHYAVVDTHRGENHLVMELLVTGRHAQTGERLNFQACDIVLFDNGALKGKRSYRKVVTPA